MPTPPAVTDVFTHVDSDPDAILEHYGGESPAELVAIVDERKSSTNECESSADASGADDLVWEFVGEPDSVVRTDDPIDETAAAVARANGGQSPVSSVESASSLESASAVGSVSSPESPPSADTVQSPESAPARGRRSLTLEEQSSTEVTLVGPDPAVRRVPDETFGRDGFVFGVTTES